MLVSYNNYQFLNEVQTTLKKMNDSEKFSFILTGSRYFGGHTEKSDYDFFVENSNGIDSFLTDLGFKRNEGPDSYLDEMTRRVYTWLPESEMDEFYRTSCNPKPNFDCFPHSSNRIDVQICGNSEDKLKVQSILKLFFNGGLKDVPKYSRSKLWNMVYNLTVSQEKLGKILELAKLDTEAKSRTY